MDKFDSDCGRVMLRNVIEDDLAVFYEHQMDPDAFRMAAYPPKERDAFLAHWYKNLADNQNVMMTILFDGKVAGNMLCYSAEGVREVGYWLGRDFWGKGIATCALQNFLEYLDERPLYAHAARHNLASRRVLEKCGFTIFGAGQSLPDADGKTVEELVFKLEATG